MLQKLQRHGAKKNDVSNENKEHSSSILITSTSAISESGKRFVPEDIKRLSSWKAHEEGIIHVKIMEDLKMIISSSFDYRVHI